MFTVIRSYFFEEKKLKNLTFFHIIVLILLSVLVFANTLQNGFVADDSSTILNWNEAHSLYNIPKLLEGNLPQYPGRGDNYRPIRSVFYAVSYQLWGGNPAGYHVQSIAIHVICVILLYFIIFELTRKKPLAFISAALFSLHPIHTEAVTYITASFDTIGVIFLLGSFYFYLRKRNYIFSVILAGLAFFTYEMTLILPLLIVLFDVCFKKLKKRDKKKRVLHYAPYFLLFIIFFFIRFLFHKSLTGKYLADSFYLTQLTMTKAYVTYVFMMLFPFHLTSNPVVWGGIQSWTNEFSNAAVIRSQSIFHFDILLAIIILALFFVVALKCLKKFPIITFCIGWFFISLLPVSYIFPQGFVLQERDAYIASVGFVLLSGYALVQLYNRRFFAKQKTVWFRNALIFVFILVLVLYAARTILRNQDYKDEFSFWHALSLQATGGAYGHLYVGDTYFNRGKYPDAIIEYKKALKDNPSNLEALYDLSFAYAENGDIHSATNVFNTAHTINPSFTNRNKQSVEDLLTQSHASQQQTHVSITGWKQSQQAALFSFSYPPQWILVTTAGTSELSDPTNVFHVSFSSLEKPANLTVSDYITTQTTSYGTITKEGAALIPNFDSAYVRIWQNANTQRMQFFLFSGDRVIEVRVSPPDPHFMPYFDAIVETIHIL